MYAGFSRDQFLSILLGSLVDQLGGIVQIDKIALNRFISEEFYAVKIDMGDDHITLEVLSENPTEAPAGKDSDKG